MKEQPFILVSAATAKPEDPYSIVGLRRTYLDRLAKHNLTPLVVHPAIGEPAIRDLYNLSSGVVLTGGQDVGVDTERDEMERWVIRRAIADNKPMIGICKGAQLIGQESGATLISDLPIETVNHGNGQLGYRASIKEFAHDVTVIDTSKDGVLFVSGQVLRNSPSNHHMAIDGENSGKVRVLGVADDGVVELGTRDDQEFCFVVQGHPEMDDQWDRLFSGLAQAALAFGRPDAIPWER